MLRFVVRINMIEGLALYKNHIGKRSLRGDIENAISTTLRITVGGQPVMRPFLGVIARAPIRILMVHFVTRGAAADTAGPGSNVFITDASHTIEALERP